MAPLENGTSSMATADLDPPRAPLGTVAEEEVESTSATRHESSLHLGPLEAGADADDAAPKISPQRSGSDIGSKPNGTVAIPPGVQRRVAELSAKAYRSASDRSRVLSRAKLADIALVRFDELQVGKFLGKGSFSSAYEITRVACAGLDEADDDERSWDGTEGARDTLGAQNQAGGFANEPGRADDARTILTKHHRREESGTYRYAVKFLKEEVRAKPQKYAVGTADLVLEGMFLASLSHPNIIKVRGLPEGGVRSLVSGSAGNNGYFLVLDRLFDTLSDRIYKVWGEEHRTGVRKKRIFIKNKEDVKERNDHLAVRLKVAFDIAGALKYLHSKSIIYRDLKPENLGFDVRGDIKLFDLGLVKELSPSEADRDGNYKMSMAGTPRYMAPEVGLYQPYNLSADVYGFAMLLYEILTLTKPLKDYTYSQLKEEIFIEGDRPPLSKVFNKRMRVLISNGWEPCPVVRPTMDEAYDEVKREYLRLAPGDVTEASLTHNRRRSTFVAKRVGNMRASQLLRLSTSDSAMMKPHHPH